MKALSAATVSAGLVALLAACGGGGGNGGHIPVGPPSLLEIGKIQVHNAISTAAQARPMGLSQSSQGGTVSTEYDGRSLTVNISGLYHLDGLFREEDIDEFAVPYSGLPGDYLEGGEYRTIGSEVSTIVGLFSIYWNRNDPADYLAGGHWVRVTGTPDPPSVAGSDSGAFIDGPEFHDSPTMPVSGSAQYKGEAQAHLSVHHGADSTIAGFKHYSGSLSLTADFRSNTIGGCIGCDMSSHPMRIRLSSTTFQPTGDFQGNSVTLEHDELDITSSGGSWGGQFSSIPTPTGEPRIVAGTVGALGATGGGSDIALIGYWLGVAN